MVTDTKQKNAGGCKILVRFSCLSHCKSIHLPPVNLLKKSWLSLSPQESDCFSPPILFSDGTRAKGAACLGSLFGCVRCQPFPSCGVILSECQNRGRENRADGGGTGRGRKRAILAAWREGRMTRISRFRFRPVAAGEDLCGQPAGRVSRAGDCRTKSQPDFVRMKAPNRQERWPEASFFPAFHTSGNFFAARNLRLCGKKEISFSKEIPFLPHENARRGGEMFHTDSSRARFLTLRGLFPPCHPAARARNLAENLPF